VDELGNLADQATPVLANLQRAAPGLNEFSVGLKPFAEAALPWFKSLGDTASTGKTDVVESQPAIDALNTLANEGGPEVKQIGGLLTSLDQNQLTRNLMNLIFFGASASNGYDGISHYLRTAALVKNCSFETVLPATGCSGNFPHFASRSVRRLTSTPAPATQSSRQEVAQGRNSSQDSALLDYLLKP